MSEIINQPKANPNRDEDKKTTDIKTKGENGEPVIATVRPGENGEPGTLIGVRPNPQTTNKNS